MIETERLLLREYTLNDFDALYEIMSDPETMQHYPEPFDENRTRNWITWNLDNYEKYGFGLWAVVLKETNEFIGDCGITIQNIDGEMLPEIGYHIHKKILETWIRERSGAGCARLGIPIHAVRHDLFLHEVYQCRILFHSYRQWHEEGKGMARSEKHHLLCLCDYTIGMGRDEKVNPGLSGSCRE